MAVKRATLVIESTGQQAHFETEPEAADGQPWSVPAVVIEVADFDEAQELVETLNRSRAQKKREKKPAVDVAEADTNGNRKEIRGLPLDAKGT